jgi:REP element-mobilizing transposase RayT
MRSGRGGLPRLRSKRLIKELRRSFGEACERGDFRLVHYSVQQKHVHFVVEADEAALGRGMKSLGALVSRAVQRVFRVTGRVLAQRYHARVLRTPREVSSVGNPLETGKSQERQMQARR